MANINDVYDEFTEKDWRLFREKIVKWQNDFIDKTNKEYIELLKQDKTPAELFWELENRIYHDKRKKGIVIEKKRSSLIYDILELLDEGAITFEDLTEFSDLLNESVLYWYKVRHRNN